VLDLANNWSGCILLDKREKVLMVMVAGFISLEKVAVT
jgi:hypothetical protein